MDDILLILNVFVENDHSENKKSTLQLSDIDYRILVNEEFHPAKSGYMSYVIAIIYTIRQQNKFVIIRIQVIMLFKRITLSFVYF